MCGTVPGEHRVHAASSRQFGDAVALRTIADESNDASFDVLDRGDGLLERVEAAEAADPTDDEPARQDRARRAATVSSGTSVKRSRSTPVGVIRIALGTRAEAAHLLGDELGAAAHDVGAAQRRRLAEPLDETAPSGPAHAPLLRLPDVRRRHEQRRRLAERAARVRGPRVWNSS